MNRPVTTIAAYKILPTLTSILHIRTCLKARKPLQSIQRCCMSSFEHSAFHVFKWQSTVYGTPLYRVIVNLWGCYGNLDCSVVWAELICRAQESDLPPLPAGGGHKGWILIGSDTSRSLPSPRRGRKLFQFQYVPRHTQTQHNKWQDMIFRFRDSYPLLSIGDLISTVKFWKCTAFCAIQVLAYGMLYDPFFFCNSFWNTIYFIPIIFWAGCTASAKHKFYLYKCLYPWSAGYFSLQIISTTWYGRIRLDILVGVIRFCTII